MKATGLLLCTLALPALMIFPAAARAADLKVGIVDIEKALSTSDLGKEAQKKYEVEVKKLQSKIDDKKGDYEKLQQAYGKQKNSLNDKARAEKEEELLSMEKELKRNFQDSQESLRRKNGQLVGELVEKLRKVVDEYGRSEHYTIILEKKGQTVLFADSSVEVTDEVVKLFNESTR